MNDLKANLSAYALSAGFSSMRICRPDSVPHIAERLHNFVEQDRHGQMDWMAERMHWRGSPSTLWPEAKSVIMLSETYTPKHDPREALAHKDCGTISVYAHGKDYHDIVKKRLKTVGRWLIEHSQKYGDPDCEIKVFVDTAPVMEKPLAQAAGLGWQGKHTNLVAKDLGSWFFLGSIFTTLELEPDTPEPDHCGSCRACLDACPTNAFPAPYQLDARRCISYLTIEHKGPVDEALRPLLGNRIYGCDDCLAACPWNKFAQEARDMRYFSKRDALTEAKLEAFSKLDDQNFRAFFSGSPIKRIGRDSFVRNVLYAIGNSKMPGLKPSAEARLGDDDAAVRDAANWALAQLSKPLP